ncbi:MAG TPA: MotA/TolQ/ExbB proton channel family protein [Oculatellaceae cyanobacterium]|jgi:biopolymer transport protein ExbB
MELIQFAIVNDWFVLLPIVACSILTLAVAIERWTFYKKNRRDVVQFIHRLQRELQRGSLENSQLLSSQLGGIIGEVSEEGVRVLAEQPESFERSYDITAALASRKLEKNLSVLGTIATISPYLGLFGTVVRILLTFGEMSKTAGDAGGAPQIMFGIGSALIATAFGLAVAIAAVALNNYFQSIVNRYEDDFQLLKLLFLSFADEREQTVAPGSQRPAAGY